jgi:predicted nuclease of predicted toxin-antitoxin system
LKFLLDVNIGTTIAHGLQHAGHDVVRAAISYPAWSDKDLLALAVQETRVVLTEDSDFTDLIFSFGMPPPPSLIYIRRDDEPQHSFLPRINEIISTARLKDHIIVLKPTNTRYRPFPKTDRNND